MKTYIPIIHLIFSVCVVTVGGITTAVDWLTTLDSVALDITSFVSTGAITIEDDPCTDRDISIISPFDEESINTQF